MYLGLKSVGSIGFARHICATTILTPNPAHLRHIDVVKERAHLINLAGDHGILVDFGNPSPTSSFYASLNPGVPGNPSSDPTIISKFDRFSC